MKMLVNSCERDKESMDMNRNRKYRKQRCRGKSGGMQYVSSSGFEQCGRSYHGLYVTDSLAYSIMFRALFFSFTKSINCYSLVNK